MAHVAKAAKRCPRCGLVESQEQGPLTICPTCGEVLGEAWALQEAVTDVVDAAWVQKFRDEGEPTSPSPDARTQLERIEILAPIPDDPTPASPSPFIAILKPFVMPQFDPTPVPAGSVMPMSEPIVPIMPMAPIVITGKPLAPATDRELDIDAYPRSLEMEAPDKLLPPKAVTPFIGLAIIAIAAVIALISFLVTDS